MKRLKKVEGYIGRNVESITMKTKTIVQIFQVIKRLRDVWILNPQGC